MSESRETYTQEQLRQLVKYAWEVRDEIDSLRDFAFGLKEETETLALENVQEVLDGLIQKMREYPNMFAGHIAQYEALRQNLVVSVNRFLASHLEQLLVENIELWPERKSDAVEPQETQESRYEQDESDDDLPF